MARRDLGAATAAAALRMSAPSGRRHREISPEEDARPSSARHAPAMDATTHPTTDPVQQRGGRRREHTPEPAPAPGDRALGAGLLVVAAACAWVAAALHLLPGGFIAVDAPTWQEALDVGLRQGATSACLALLAVGAATTGLRLVLAGRAHVRPSLLLVALAGPAVVAAGHGLWLLAAGSAALGAALLLVLRRS